MLTEIVARFDGLLRSEEVWRVACAEISFADFRIDSQTGNGVESSVSLLLFRQIRSFPVGQALSLGDAFVENDAVDAGERVVDNANSFDVLLEVDKTGGGEGADFIKVQEIVVDREANFEEDGIFEEVNQRLDHTYFINSEKEAMFRRR